jgi:uncharacterized SAM-binding protein YcdF (DUF218 family)
MKSLLHRVGLFALLWGVLVALPEWPWLRAVLARPLDVHVDDARGEVAYVLGAGSLSIGERLSAAADLYHEGRVRRVMLPADPTMGRFDFQLGRNRTADEWSRAHLRWLGVPEDKIALVPVAEAWLDTAAEAEGLRAALRPDETHVVLVSAPVHLRRAALAFRRALGPSVTVTAFGSSALPDGPDFQRPLWLEYFKLGVYALVL